MNCPTAEQSLLLQTFSISTAQCRRNSNAGCPPPHVLWAVPRSLNARVRRESLMVQRTWGPQRCCWAARRWASRRATRSGPRWACIAGRWTTQCGCSTRTTRSSQNSSTDRTWTFLLFVLVCSYRGEKIILTSEQYNTVTLYPYRECTPIPLVSQQTRDRPSNLRCGSKRERHPLWATGPPQTCSSKAPSATAERSSQPDSLLQQPKLKRVGS